MRPSSLATLALCVGTAAGCGEEGPWPDPASEEHSVLRTSDAALTIPRQEDSVVIGSAWDLDVSGGQIFVLDRAGGKIYRFGADGRLRSAFGRQGEGPGELSTPWRIVVRDSVLWVGDPENARVLGFDYGGDPVESIPLPLAFHAMSFAPWSDGTVLAPSVERGGLLTRLDSAGARELVLRPALPDELSSDSPVERLQRAGITGWLLASAGPNAVFLLVNRGNSSLWRIGIEGDTVTEISRLPLPDELTGRIVEDARRLTEALSSRTRETMTTALFQGLRAGPSGKELWLPFTTRSTPAVGVEISLSGGRVTYVVPRGGQGSGVRGTLLRGGRLYALRDTLVRVYSVHPAAP